MTGAGDDTEERTDGQRRLAEAVRETELHVAAGGWDQPARLFALVETAALVRQEPSLADALGIDPGEPGDGLTPVEQEELPPDRSLEDVLRGIVWPPEVDGCVAVVERLVLPPGADEQLPADAEEAASYAASHPERQEVRLVAAATRTGGAWCALRLRSHDEDDAVLAAPDLVPALLDLVRATLEDEPS